MGEATRRKSWSWTAWVRWTSCDSSAPFQSLVKIISGYICRLKIESYTKVTPFFPDPIPEVMWSRGRLSHQPLEQKNYCYIFFCQYSCGLWSDQKIEIRIVSCLIKGGVHPTNKTGRSLGVKLLLHLHSSSAIGGFWSDMLIDQCQMDFCYLLLHAYTYISASSKNGINWNRLMALLWEQQWRDK